MQDCKTEAAVGSAARGAVGAWARFLFPAVVGLAGDLWLKAYAFPEGVQGGVGPMGRNPAGFMPPEDIVPHVLGFTTTVNHGAVFGLGQGWGWFFLGFSTLALGLIVWVFVTSRARQWAVHIALGLILAGALGNMYDRIVYQGVRDMLKFNVSWYPFIFNLADVLLCVGVPVLMLRWMVMGTEVSSKK